MKFIKEIWYGIYYQRWSTWDKIFWIFIIARDKFPLSKRSRMIRRIRKLEKEAFGEGDKK